MRKSKYVALHAPESNWYYLELTSAPSETRTHFNSSTESYVNPSTIGAKRKLQDSNLYNLAVISVFKTL